MAQFDDRNMMDDVEEDKKKASQPIDNVKDNLSSKVAKKINNNGRNLRNKMIDRVKGKSGGAKNSPVPNSTAGKAAANKGAASGGAKAANAAKATAKAGQTAAKAGKAAAAAGKAAAGAAKVAGEAIIATLPYSLIVLAVIIVIALIAWVLYCAMNGTLFNIATKIHDGVINDAREIGKLLLPHATEEEIDSLKENDWRFKYNTLSAEQQYDYICNGNTALASSNEALPGLVQYIEKGYLNAKIAYSNTLGNIQIYSDGLRELEDQGKTIKSIENYRLHSSSPTNQQLYSHTYRPYTNVDIANNLLKSGLIEPVSIDPDEDYTDDDRLEGKTAPYTIIYFGEGSGEGKDAQGTTITSAEIDGDKLYINCYNQSLAYKCAMRGGIFSAIAGMDSFDSGDLDATMNSFIEGKILKGTTEDDEEYETSSFREWTRISYERRSEEGNPDGDGIFDNTVDNFVNFTGYEGGEFENVGPRDYYYYFKTAVAYATMIETQTQNDQNVQNENAYVSNITEYARRVRDGSIIYRNPYINEINYFDYIVLYGSTGLKSDEEENSGSIAGVDEERVLFDIDSKSHEGAAAGSRNNNGNSKPTDQWTAPKQNTIKERYLLNLDLTYLANYELLCPELNPDGKFAFAKNSQMMNTVNYLIAGMDVATCNISPAWGYLDFLSKTIGHEEVFNSSLRFSDQFRGGYISDNGQFGWFVKFIIEPDVVESTDDRKPEQYPRLAYLLQDELELRHDLPALKEDEALAENDDGGPVHYRKVNDPKKATDVEKPDFCKSYVWIESNESGPEEGNDAGNTAPDEEGMDSAGDPIHESNHMGILDMAGAEVVAMKGAFLGYDMYGVPCYQYYIKITDPIDTDRLLWSMLVSDSAKTMTYNGIWDTLTLAYQGSYYEAYQCFEPLSASIVQGKVSWLEKVGKAIDNFFATYVFGEDKQKEETLSLARAADADQIRRYLYGLTPEEARDEIHLITDEKGDAIKREDGSVYTVKDYFEVLYERGEANKLDKALLYSDLLVDKNRDGEITYDDYMGIMNETYFSYTPRFLYQCDYLSGELSGIESLKNCHNLMHDSYGVSVGDWQALADDNNTQIITRCLYHQYNDDGLDNCAECLRLNGGIEAEPEQLGGTAAYRWAQDMPALCPDCEQDRAANQGATSSYVQKSWSGRPKIEYVRNSEPEFCDIISISEEEYISYINNDATPLSFEKEDIGLAFMELEGNKKVDLATNYNRQGYGYNPTATMNSEDSQTAPQPANTTESNIGVITNPDGSEVDLGDTPEYNYYFSEYEWYAELGSDEKWVKLKDVDSATGSAGDGFSEKISLTGYIDEETEEEIHPVTNSYDEWEELVSSHGHPELLTHASVKSLSDLFDSKQRIAADYNRQKWVDYTKKTKLRSNASDNIRDYRAVSLQSALYQRKYNYDNLLNYDTYKSGFWDEGNGHEPAPAISREIAEYDDKGNIIGFYSTGDGSSKRDAFDDEFHNDKEGFIADEHGNLISEGNGTFKKSEDFNTSFLHYDADAVSDDVVINDTGDTLIQGELKRYRLERDEETLFQMYHIVIIGGYQYQITGLDIVGMMIDPQGIHTFESIDGGPPLTCSLKSLLDPDDPVGRIVDDAARTSLASLAASSLPFATYGFGVEKDIGTPRQGEMSDLTFIDYRMGALLKDKTFNTKYVKAFWNKVKKDVSFDGSKYKKISMKTKREDL